MVMLRGQGLHRSVCVTVLLLGSVNALATGPDPNAAPAPVPAATSRLVVPGAPQTPASTAFQRATATLGMFSVTAGVLNPSPSGAPLWLWLEPAGTASGEVLVEDVNGTVLWRKPATAVVATGEIAVVPRPSALGVRVVVLGTAGDRAASADMVVIDPRMRALSLPVLVVGGAQAASLAERMRSRTSDRLVHTLPAAALPTAPATFLGVSAVILGPDAEIPDAQGLALKLFNCARGGVMSLAPLSLGGRADCPDPVLVMGSQGQPSASEILGSLKDLQASLGILEERSGTGMGPGADDVDAAGALLARRPSAKAAVGTLALVFLLMASGLYFCRRLAVGQAVAVLITVPLVGGVLVATWRVMSGAELQAVRLVTVDARQGAPVALSRTVEAAWQPHRVEASPTAWVVRPEPSRDKADGDALPSSVEIWDVVEVDGAMSVAPHPGQPEQMMIKIPGTTTPASAVSCGRAPKDAPVPGDPLQQAHGRLLLERCMQHQRGTVGLVEPAWIPAVQKTFGELPATAVQSAWLYLLVPKGGRS